MIFVGGRRAEKREDAVTGRLHDVAAVALDRIDHQLERGVDNCARLFRIQVLHQFHGAHDVGEQRGYRLAFAIEILRQCTIEYPNR